MKTLIAVLKLSIPDGMTQTEAHCLVADTVAGLHREGIQICQTSTVSRFEPPKNSGGAVLEICPHGQKGADA